VVLSLRPGIEKVGFVHIARDKNIRIMKSDPGKSYKLKEREKPNG
jgi:hypothetical protein